MADRNRATLLELLNKPGNNVCADCKSPGLYLLKEYIICVSSDHL